MQDNNIFKKLEDKEHRFDEIERLLSSSELDPEDIKSYSKERSELEDTVLKYREYKDLLNSIEENKSLLDDPEVSELAREELNKLEKSKKRTEEELKLLLLPKDPDDNKNIILEIRAGTGGDEAALFAADLLRMYSRYCENKNFKINIMSLNETGIGGIKEVVANIEGKNVYKKLKYESGVHRVQRVPSTETGGRIHTSTATVAVLPEPEDVDINIDEKDLKVDTYRASGPGGQHVNKTDSAIRITHIPTGIVVQCQEGRSQHKNRADAMRMLKAKLYEEEEKKKSHERSETRKNQVGTGERSEKIRTYNFPQSRITDHRIGLTLQNIDSIMDGEIDEFIDRLTSHFQSESIKQLTA